VLAGRLVPISLAIIWVACTSCSEPLVTPTESGSSAVDVTIAPVVGGKTSAACGWPSTVDVNGCTGTLIHPLVVTTAAHCMNGSTGKVTFTAGKGMPGSFSLTGKCKAGATGSSGGGTGKDWAYCVLPADDRVKQIPITPPLVGCEAERFLKVGASGWVVGFGTTGANLNDNGIKREVEVKINRIDTSGIVDIGDKQVGACHGDSGGPIYMKLTDGMHDWGYRVFGSTSSAGGNCDCTCSTRYVNIAQHVKAIEENEKIDVTPCTDASGNWAPTADCKEFQSDPANATGTYPMCTVAVTHDPIATCDGAPPPTAGSNGMANAGRSGSSATAGSGAAGGGGSAGGAIAGAGALAAGSGTAGTAGSAGTTLGAAGSTRASGTSGSAAGSGVLRPLTTAGATGTLTMGVQTAGAPASITGPGPATNPAPESSGCQVSSVGGRSPQHAFWLLGMAVTGVCYRSRQRRRTSLHGVPRG
jgi:hypothetical protein